tara:strand:- start:662 stop:769 length:108 start_codon:yes stop_codon:yes gene_type:complete
VQAAEVEILEVAVRVLELAVIEKVKTLVTLIQLLL